MFALLRVCLFSVFAEGFRADTRDKEAAPGAVSLPCAFMPEED